MPTSFKGISPITWMQRQTNDPAITGIYESKDTWSYSVTCGDFAHPYPTGDLTGDCHVDSTDLALIASQWHQPAGDPSADIAPPGGDNFVDLRDLAVLLENWLHCTTPHCPEDSP